MRDSVLHKAVIPACQTSNMGNLKDPSSSTCSLRLRLGLSSVLDHFLSLCCTSFPSRILECAKACAPSNNKNVRLSLATVLLNMSSTMHASCAPISSSSVVSFFDTVEAIAGCGKYDTEARVRVLVALGTMLLVPGAGGVEARRAATERGLGALAERVASGHGDLAMAVAKEISMILS